MVFNINTFCYTKRPLQWSGLALFVYKVLGSFIIAFVNVYDVLISVLRVDSIGSSAAPCVCSGGMTVGLYAVVDAVLRECFPNLCLGFHAEGGDKLTPVEYG